MSKETLAEGNGRKYERVPVSKLPQGRRGKHHQLMKGIAEAEHRDGIRRTSLLHLESRFVRVVEGTGSEHSCQRKKARLTPRPFPPQKHLLWRKQVGVLLTVLQAHPDNLSGIVNAVGLRQGPARTGKDLLVQILDLAAAEDERMIRILKRRLPDHHSEIVDAETPCG